MTRTWRQQWRIEETVGEDWQRPIGMRHRTYARLLDRLEVCQQKRDEAFCVAASGLLRRIGVRNVAL